ncbi:MAG: hypothetical protein PWR30_45 [Candidatus Woesearchaeota archaeon]|nr:hypothetical protein [Candidatus Woesearchaeota archaeon]
MNKKEEIKRLRQWARTKSKEGYSKNQLKYALRRKGISESDAEKIVSKGLNYKLVISLIVIAAVISLLIFLLSTEPKTDIKEGTSYELSIDDFEDLNFEGFSKRRIENGFSFTRIEENASPTIITLSLSYLPLEQYLNDFLNRNMKAYKSFRQISRQNLGEIIWIDYAYNFGDTEFIVSQRIIPANNNLIDLSIRAERKLYNQSTTILEKGIEDLKEIISNIDNSAN